MKPAWEEKAGVGVEANQPEEAGQGPDGDAAGQGHAAEVEEGSGGAGAGDGKEANQQLGGGEEDRPANAGGAALGGLSLRQKRKALQKEHFVSAIRFVEPRGFKWHIPSATPPPKNGKCSNVTLLNWAIRRCQLSVGDRGMPRISHQNSEVKRPFGMFNNFTAVFVFDRIQDANMVREWLVQSTIGTVEDYRPQMLTMESSGWSTQSSVARLNEWLVTQRSLRRLGYMG